MSNKVDNKLNKRFVPLTTVRSGKGEEVRKDIYVYPVQIANVIFVGYPGQTNEWFIVDAGMPRSGKDIISEAKERFGETNPPKAVVVTHGHFDHVGALFDIVEEWDVPVYAHEKELPFLRGEETYREPDSSVEGGMVPKLAPMLPTNSIDLGEKVQPLPEEGSIPGMPEWEWLSTPGHTEGHISLYRQDDKVLLAGDAFVTVKQESLYKAMKQEKEICGPPKYLTPDWEAAKHSVSKLNSLPLDLAVTGHGYPMEGEELREGLQDLADNFDSLAVPEKGDGAKEDQS
ncbi:MBL fold metallo-hydrolase [Thalassorhabdus alkalitolerans]|uniref:MBL fold metallo-hydrolase n=1 Tax=Thalassorhabdus alkalitolerans TaxID=2282697 RepID=A0ABW0YPJ8_9BACI